jgi:hypothetical protein
LAFRRDGCRELRLRLGRPPQLPVPRQPAPWMHLPSTSARCRTPCRAKRRGCAAIPGKGADARPLPCLSTTRPAGPRSSLDCVSVLACYPRSSRFSKGLTERSRHCEPRNCLDSSGEPAFARSGNSYWPRPCTLAYLSAWKCIPRAGCRETISGSLKAGLAAGIEWRGRSLRGGLLGAAITVDHRLEQLTRRLVSPRAARPGSYAHARGVGGRVGRAGAPESGGALLSLPSTLEISRQSLLRCIPRSSFSLGSRQATERRRGET